MLKQTCQHAIPDNQGLINCTKADNHIGLCQNPCPYSEKQHLQLVTQCTYMSREAEIEAFPPGEARGKLCFTVFACTYICTLADGVDV